MTDRQQQSNSLFLFRRGGGIKKITYYSLISGFCVYCTSKQGIKLMLDSCEKALIDIYAFTVTVFIFSGHLHQPIIFRPLHSYGERIGLPTSRTAQGRNWRWIGHVFCRDNSSNIRTMLRRTGMANSWREVHVVASDHGKRRLLLHCLMSPTGHGGDN